MKINFTNKTNRNKIYFIINGKHKIKNEELKNYAEKFRFETGQDWKLELFTEIENNKKHLNILIFVKNNKKFQQHLEDIVAKLGNIIKQENTKFSLSLKKLGIDAELQEIFVELLAQKLYSFNKFKTKKDTKYSINIDANINEEKIQTKIQTLYLVRDLQNLPANHLNPDTYEEEIKKIFKNYKNVKINIIKGKELEKLGAGGIYSVGKGSQYEPRLIILEYSNNKKQPYVALAGKGVTFDSGGYNIKPTGYMEDMHLDMGGSAVSLGIFKYLVDTNYKGNLVCGLGLAENLVSAKSYTPTDVIKMYNGKYVQIRNTDAEGRLVLADVLSYLEDKYNIEKIFDFATLTGAAIVALGEDIFAMLGRNEKIINKVKKISWDIKEPSWELPLYKKYKQKLKSNFADLANCSSGREAGTITAGLFLGEFIKNENWVHFDIAGPDICSNHPIYENGGSAVGVRTMIKFLEQEDK